MARARGLSGTARSRLVLLLLGFAILAGCSDRGHRNPLDPQAVRPATDLVQPMRALAGDGEVLLRWDYTYFEDVAGYYLYRRAPGREFARLTPAVLPPETRQYVDEEVENGATYEYRLGLLIQGEGEREVDLVERVTPGREVAWVADRSSGLVWKISPDGRDAYFAQGRFPSLEGMDLDLEDGSCWVSDRYFSGVYRIAPEGELEPHPGDVGEAGPLAIDRAHRRAWLVDRQRQAVRWFALGEPGDTLALGKVDANFIAPGSLAPQDGGCWIADDRAGRVLFFHPQGERVEFRELIQPAGLAAAGVGGVWGLVDGGWTLVRLDREGGRWEMALPFGGVDLSADPERGQVWVLGETELGLFTGGGEWRQAWTELPGGRSLEVDAVNGGVWIATPLILWKFTRGGELLARLEGFSGLVRVAVDPGRGR